MKIGIVNPNGSGHLEQCRKYTKCDKIIIPKYTFKLYFKRNHIDYMKTVFINILYFPLYIFHSIKTFIEIRKLKPTTIYNFYEPSCFWYPLFLKTESITIANQYMIKELCLLNTLNSFFFKKENVFGDISISKINKKPKAENVIVYIHNIEWFIKEYKHLSEKENYIIISNIQYTTNYNNISFINRLNKKDFIKLITDNNTKYIITNGGFNLMIETLELGVENIIIPLHIEQKFNKSFYEKRKL